MNSSSRDHDHSINGGRPQEAPSLTDADLDDMHHALGRPTWPWRETYRNYYATDRESDQARRFMELGVWTRGGVSPGGMAYFHVNSEGQQAVSAWVRDRQAAKGLRRYRVWLEREPGGESCSRTFLAKSHGAAKYRLFLDLSDAWNIGWPEFASWSPRATLADGEGRVPSSTTGPVSSPGRNPTTGEDSHG